jgi:translocation and assembly module TamB
MPPAVRRLVIPLAIIALLAGAFFAGVQWLARSPDALRWSAARIEAALGGRLELRGLSGSLASRFLIERATFVDGRIRVELEDVAIAWSLRGLLSRSLAVRSLEIRRAQVVIEPSEAEPAPPATLALPIDIVADRVDVRELTAQAGGASPLRVTELGFAYRGGRTHHGVEALTVRAPWGRLAGAVGLGARDDFPIEGTLDWTLADLPVEGQVTAALTGRLRDIEIPWEGTALGEAIKGRAIVRPFDRERIAALEADASGVDLAKHVEGAPATALALTVVADIPRDAPISGRLEVANATPGRVSADRLPLVRASARVQLTAAGLELSEVEADLGAAGRVRGDARVAAESTTVGLDVERLDLDALHAELAPTALGGRIDAVLGSLTQRVTATLAERDLAFDAEAIREGERVTVPRFAVTQRGGRLDGNGWIELDGPRRFDADVRFRRIDPSRFADVPPARLTGTMQAAGALAPAWQVRARFELRDSTLRGRTFSGSGSINADPQRIATPGAQLRIGDNRLQLAGVVGDRATSLSFALSAPALDQIDPQLAGAVTARGTVSGRPVRPVVDGEFDARELTVADYRAARIQGTARLAYGPDPQLRLLASGERLIAPPLGELATARVEFDGRQADHTARVSVKGRVFDASASARGAYVDRRWTGELSTFENLGAYAMRLTAPVSLRVGPGDLRAGAAHLVGKDIEAQLDRLEFGVGRIATAGRFSGVPFAAALALAGADAPGTTLRLRGRWELETSPRLNGTVEIEREAGDIVLGGDTPYRLRLAALEVSGRIVDDRLTLDGLAKDADGVEARAAAVAEPVAGVRPPALTGDSPITAKVQVTAPTLSALDRFAGANASVSGQARAMLDVSGTLAEPVFSGTLAVDDARIAAPQQSVFLNDGRLRASLRGREIEVEELSIAGGSGRLSASGQLAFTDADAESALDWRAENFRLFSSPTRRLVLDGAGSFALRDRTLVGRGELRASQAHFTLTQAQGPRLANDVVVVGRETASRERSTPLPLDIDMTFDFGQRFRIEERGLDALLSGRVRVRSNGVDPPVAEGVVNVDRGTFLAYGQTLFIEDSRLLFSGPADDPGLEITAVRRNLPVQVGMRITGTARVPVIRLFSEPPMADNEVLSWLVLGRSPGNTSTADSALLAAAAEALLAGPTGTPITTRMARQLGLDEFGLRSDGDEGEAFALGRRLSDRVYLFLQRGLTAATTTLIIEYALTRELRLRAEAGDVSGLGVSWGRTLD